VFRFAAVGDCLGFRPGIHVVVWFWVCRILLKGRDSWLFIVVYTSTMTCMWAGDKGSGPRGGDLHIHRWMRCFPGA
jgi:hypothetical protein